MKNLIILQLIIAYISSIPFNSPLLEKTKVFFSENEEPDRKQSNEQLSADPDEYLDNPDMEVLLFDMTPLERTVKQNTL